MLVLWATGCASADLSQHAETTAEVVECLPPDTPAPVALVRAIWYPNSSGFGSTDASAVGHLTGVLALAGEKLWFVAWNAEERHFDVLHVVAVLPAAKISVVRLGPLALLVIQSRNNSFDSFELMHGGQFGADLQMTQELNQKIQSLRAKRPQPDH